MNSSHSPPCSSVPPGHAAHDPRANAFITRRGAVVTRGPFGVLTFSAITLIALKVAVIGGIVAAIALVLFVVVLIGRL